MVCCCIKQGKNCALQCLSNTAEYEAHLTGLAITHVINTMHLKIEDAQRHEDRYARGTADLKELKDYVLIS